MAWVDYLPNPCQTLKFRRDRADALIDQAQALEREAYQLRAKALADLQHIECSTKTQWRASEIAQAQRLMQIGEQCPPYSLARYGDMARRLRILDARPSAIQALEAFRDLRLILSPKPQACARLDRIAQWWHLAGQPALRQAQD